MEQKYANFTAIGLGAVTGIVAVVFATGAMAPVWSIFMNGLVQHFMAMQWARFICF